jgi:hypothetical protein
MKITTQNKSKISLIIAVCIIALLGAYTAAAYHYQLFPFQPNVPEVSKEITDPTSSPDKEAIPTGEYTDKTTNDIPTNPTLAATIDQLEQKNGVVLAKGSVNTSDASGLCSFVFSNDNDKPITQTVNPTLKDTQILCGPIEIPEQSFSFLGEWNVSFRYYSNNTQVSTESKITIK